MGLYRTILLGLFCWNLGASANPIETWNNQTTNIGGATFYGIADGNNTLVAAGGFSICTSTNGTSWEPKSLPGSGSLYDVCYGNGMFVVVGRSIWTSTNGLNWVNRVGSITPAPQNVAFGNGIFVAVGGGTCWRSIDGVTWTVHSTPTAPSEYLDVCHVNGMFLMPAFQSVYSSTNGTNWSATSVPSLALTPNTITHGKGLIVVAGSGGKLATSTNGVDWTMRSTGTTASLYSSVFGNGLFLVGGESVLLSSEDGVTWTKRLFSQSGRLWVGDVGFSAFHTAVSGTILRSGSLAVPWQKVQLSNDTFKIFATGEIGDVYRLQTSSDLVEWTDHISYTNDAFTMEVLSAPRSTDSNLFYRVIRP